MVKITCFKCHWSWSLNQSEVATALESMAADVSHYSVECPRCRRVNKVPRKQLEHARPHPSTTADAKE